MNITIGTLRPRLAGCAEWDAGTRRWAMAVEAVVAESMLTAENDRAMKSAQVSLHATGRAALLMRLRDGLPSLADQSERLDRMAGRVGGVVSP